jgi:beta-galactosidase
MNFNNDVLDEIYYGGDYNPEQWDEKIWFDDVRLMKKANVNLITIGVFSWATLQSDDENYHFEWLDKIIDLLYKNGIYIDLATATASPPAWLIKRYPDILPVDYHGIKYSFGSRQSYCPNNENYRSYALKLTEQLANRYKNKPALAMWHINNEYACHISECYCDTCQLKFRVWLTKKYKTINSLNNFWGTYFWSQKYYNWDEISLPKYTPMFHNPAQVLDYKRFMSDSLLECYSQEYNKLKEITPDINITTNFIMELKSLDFFKWAKEIDVISIDVYPDPSSKEFSFSPAFNYDLMRGLKDGKSFMLMEQSPNQVNWRGVNYNKRPGQMRLLSYLALAHGSDSVMFFQWRQSVKGAEKLHSGMITHTQNEDSRVFREIETLGNELKMIKEIKGAVTESKVAFYFDFENWWALEYSPGPSQYLKYLEQIYNYYNVCKKMNISVDIINSLDNLLKYKVFIAPTMYMVKSGNEIKIENYVKEGGIFITTFFSGVINEFEEIFHGGYPGSLKTVLGIEVEEYDQLMPEMKNKIIFSGKEYSCNLWCDIVKLKTAKILGKFGSDYYQGYPAITENNYGKGKSYYISTQPEKRFIFDFFKNIFDSNGIKPVFDLPENVEVNTRIKNGIEYHFIINYNNKEVEIDLKNKFINIISNNICENKLSIKPNDIFIIKKAP